MPEITIDTITLGLIWFAVFLFSTTCHEGAHALVAKLGGDPTGSGQVTLNPIPHIQREKFGMVVVPILSYLIGGWMIGWASTPYDPRWAYNHPHRAARMALAGPVTNFSLMLLAAIGIRVGLAVDFFQAPATIAHYAEIAQAVDSSGIGSLIAPLLSILFALNLILGIFNLIPVPPLDGNMGITLFMSENNARRFLDAFRSGLGMMGLFLAWMLFDRIFDPIYTIALSILYYPLASYS